MGEDEKNMTWADFRRQRGQPKRGSANVADRASRAGRPAARNTLMRRYIAVAILTVSAASVMGQEVVDVIVTKDGNEYRGLIIENKINEYLRIELSDGSVFRLSYDTVDVVRKERTESKKDPRTPITFHPGANFFESAYYRYNSQQFPLQPFGGFTALVDEM